MSKVIIPENGKKISMEDGKFIVPNNPIIPFIEGDGIGPDIWKSAVRVFDSAVQKAYNGERKFIGWKYMLGKNQTLFMVKILGCRKKH